MKIQITMIMEVPRGFYAPAFIGLIQGYIELKVLDWKWKKLSGRKKDTILKSLSPEEGKK